MITLYEMEEPTFSEVAGMIKNSGWEAFESGQTRRDNPYYANSAAVDPIYGDLWYAGYDAAKSYHDRGKWFK